MLYKNKVKTTILAVSGLVISSLSFPSLSEVSNKSVASDTLEKSTRSSTSISVPKSMALDKNARDEKLKLANTDTMPALIKNGNRIEITSSSINPKKSNSNDFSVGISSHDFNLYDADTELISDFNNDGFYHRFSVSFDVDTIYDVAYVYAEVYLSYEGGPWNHYATSDNYPIYLDSNADYMTIETELADGFPSGYYDIRIEIYDADYNDWLLSYGPYDDASLSALPLEDSYYDDNNYYGGGHISTELIISGHGHGAMSWSLLILPALIIFTRKKRI